MSEKTIKDRIAKLVKDNRINIREALDLTEKELIFLEKCYDSSHFYHEDYDDDGEYNVVGEEALHSFSKEMEGTRTIALEKLLTLYRKDSFSHETHCFIYQSSDFYREDGWFLVTPRPVFEAREAKLRAFKKEVQKELNDYLQTLSLKDTYLFFERVSSFIQENGRALYDAELTILAYYRAKAKAKDGYVYFYRSKFNEETFEIEKT